MDIQSPYTNYYNYVAHEAIFQLILHTRNLSVNPHAQVVWLSPTRYDDPSLAQTELALRFIPCYRIGPIARDVIPSEHLIGPRLADPRDGFPGGGIEVGLEGLFEIDPGWMVYDFGSRLYSPMDHYIRAPQSIADEYYSCFISYSHLDRLFARTLQRKLQDRGIHSWLYEDQMLPGDDIYEEISLGIKLRDKVLLCCSKASLMSWWVDYEIDKAFEKERQLMQKHQERVSVLIPLNLDNYMFTPDWNDPKGSEVKRRLAADFTGWEDDAKFEEQVSWLILALRADRTGRRKPPASKI
jgi:hypothetical protein